MHPHYLVLNNFTDNFGVAHMRGDVIVIGDSTPPEGLTEIMVQIEAGNLREIKAGEGVARPEGQ
jgi:hypothetical protein